MSASGRRPDTGGRPADPGKGAPALDESGRLAAPPALYTTLELEALLRLFSREVAVRVPHSGVVFLDTQGDERAQFGRRARCHSSFRLVVGRRPLGDIRFYRGRPFDEPERGLLERMLSWIAHPVRNALRYEQALKASLTDPLTGVYNRGVLETALRREVGLARRHGSALSLLVLDVDEFKRINDRFGHQAGDQVLEAVAACVRGCLRGTDLLARYGGDEFVALLSNTGAEGAAVLARNVLARLAELDLHGAPGALARVEASVGVATLREGESAEAFFARADARLYAAKRRGRSGDPGPQ